MTTTQKQKQLSDTQNRILELAATWQGITQGRCVEVLEKSKSTLSEAVDDLEDRGLVKITHDQGIQKLIEVTRDGALEAVGGQRPNGGSDQGEVSLHNFSVRFDLRGAQELDDGWRERWAQGHTRRQTYDPTNGSHVYWVDDWRFRITGDHVIVRLERELRGDDPVNLKDRAMVEIFEARDWIEERLPGRASIRSEPADFRIWVQRQHLALVQDPFCQLVDQYSSVDLDDVKIYDEDGTERLWLDNSDGEQHLEAGNAPGENREFAEDDIEFLRSELYEWLIDNKDEWQTLQALASVVERERSGQKNEVAEKKAPSGTRERSITDELTISSRWLHRGGHLMGWCEELGKPIKLVDESDLP